ncbi:MAG: dihydrolipoyl dehydrogenase [Synergistaceae bacterium]|jgi:dihydrolipoamide dehydrogenase|nr:dihydrolipoyl dehydrogenase [Synergistaceae bacterium]
MSKFDLIIIGGGPAGYVAAERASDGGMSVALFDMNKLGGVCLNEGCIPTKTMLYSAKLLDGAVHGAPYGVIAENARLDHQAVMKRKDKVVKILSAGLAFKMKAKNVTVIYGKAAISGKTDFGFAVTSDGQIYEARKLLIASGSQSVTPPIEGIAESLASRYAITSREALAMTAIPERLAVIGGGVIGLELACYFNAAGSKVTVVEMLDKIAGPMEDEISTILLGSLKKRGVDFRLGAKVTRAERYEGVTIERDGEPAEILPADAILAAVGRKPRSDGLELDSIGVRTERGSVVTDKYMQTGVPGVYAAGDVTGKVMLAHAASREAEAAVANMLGGSETVNYGAIPSVIYTTPEAASVGETLKSAAERGLPANETKLSMRFSGRYVAENEGGDGICKVVTDGSGRVIGTHIIGSCASEIIASAVMMIESRMPVSDLKRVVFPHPTVGEILRESLFQIREDDL